MKLYTAMGTEGKNTWQVWGPISGVHRMARRARISGPCAGRCVFEAGKEDSLGRHRGTSHPETGGCPGRPGGFC